MEKFVGVMKFDTIITLTEFFNICYDLLKQGIKLRIEIESDLEGKIQPEKTNLQIIMTKKITP